MKKLIVFFLAGVVMTMAVQAGAFDVGVGARYFTGRLPGMRCSDIDGQWRPVDSQSGLIQGEVLIGPVQFAIGYVEFAGNIGNACPVTIGCIYKFPMPIIKPYIGIDLSFLLDVNSSAFSAYRLIFTVQPKAGVEVRLGSMGVYGGVGYSLVDYGTFALYGLTFEIGGRVYLSK